MEEAHQQDGPRRRRIILNGKFLMAAPTGVHRVAEQLILALDQILAESPQLQDRLDVELFAPRRLHHTLPLKFISFCQGGVFTHIPWEQFDLPFRAMRRDAMIVSLCNLGPVAATSAITMIHDAQVHISPESYSRPFRLWYKFVQPLIGRRHRRILTVSDFSRRQLAKAGISKIEKTSVVHNGVDHVSIGASNPDVIKLLRLKAGEYVLGLANTQRHKNIRVLLSACLDQRMKDRKLVLFGAASQADLEEMSGMALPPNVVMAGKVSDGELKALMENALCLAFPSITEGFGLPPLEAMTVGCPSVCAPCGALPEVCGDAVLYADPNDPGAWVQAILSIAAEPHRREGLVEAGYQHARKFTWANAANILVAMLDPSLESGAFLVRPCDPAAPRQPIRPSADRTGMTAV